MKQAILNTFLLALLACLPCQSALGEEGKKPQGPPPMLVETTAVSQGLAEPMVDLVGTIRYARVSRVASENPGIVEAIDIREGARVKAGQQLARLRSDLLEIRIRTTRAGVEQAEVELERARKDLLRIEALFKEKSVSEALYDENHYRVLGLEKKLAGLKATLDLQRLELAKASIRAPFAGLVQEKLTEQGEWLNTGGQVAVIADDHAMEVAVDVPQRLLGFLQSGRKIAVRSGGRNLRATFVHFIPQGDVATRTFRVKLRIDAADGLVEGMEARASLPNGPKLDGLLVPRDAVIKQFGKQLVFLAIDGKAKMVPVKVNGYQEMMVSVEGPGLTAGALVVTKGNERIRDGQAVRF